MHAEMLPLTILMKNRPSLQANCEEYETDCVSLPCRMRRAALVTDVRCSCLVTWLVPARDSFIGDVCRTTVHGVMLLPLEAV